MHWGNLLLWSSEMCLEIYIFVCAMQIHLSKSFLKYCSQALYKNRRPTKIAWPVAKFRSWPEGSSKKSGSDSCPPANMLSHLPEPEVESLRPVDLGGEGGWRTVGGPRVRLHWPEGGAGQLDGGGRSPIRTRCSWFAKHAGSPLFKRPHIHKASRECC